MNPDIIIKKHLQVLGGIPNLKPRPCQMSVELLNYSAYIKVFESKWSEITGNETVYFFFIKLQHLLHIYSILYVYQNQFVLLPQS